MTTKSNNAMNLTTLYREIHETARQVKAGRLSVEKAATFSALASRAISGVRAQIDYSKARKEKPDLPHAK